MQDQAANAALTNIQSQVSAVEGVNIADQAVKAAQYQTMYNAGIKMIQAQTSMLGTLLNIMG